MKLAALSNFDLLKTNWEDYDAIFLASGFEARSTFVFKSVPDTVLTCCVVLGFNHDLDVHSRKENDAIYSARGITPFVAETPIEYEEKIKATLFESAKKVAGRPLRIFVDYSVMTRAWYAVILTWLRYSGDVVAAELDLVYSHGKYLAKFSALQIKEANLIPGFEGVSAGSRRTVAFYGLGYDKYATLTVHDIIQPDSFICYVASEGQDDLNSQYVIRENSEIIELSGQPPLLVSLSNLDSIVKSLTAEIVAVPDIDEVIAVPMGPKTHVLATLLVAQTVPRLTCMHPLGFREKPVQVEADGALSCWKATFKI